jgi:hypothetical protein
VSRSIITNRTGSYSKSGDSRVRVYGPRWMHNSSFSREEFGVLVVAERLAPFPEGTLGHESGRLDEVTVYREFVAGSERYDAEARNKIGSRGAFCAVPPDAARVDAAIARAHEALRVVEVAS